MVICLQIPILKRCKNCVSQFLNVHIHRFSDIRQVEIHTADPLVPGPST
jgi:hypothetical protein